MLRKKIPLLSKRANAIIDTATVIVVLTVFGIISIIGFNVFKDLEPDMREAFTMTEANDTINLVNERYPSNLDGAFMFIFVGMWIFAIVASFMIDTHPIFFIIAIILLLFIIIASIYIGNFFEETMDDAEFSDVASDFPMTMWTMSHLLMVSLIIGFSIIGTMYAKSMF